MTNIATRFGLMSLLLASAAVPTLAHAQATPVPDKEAGGVSDIVVTAQRREERLQDVPLAVSALSAVSLERAQVSSTTSLMQIVPNLSGGQVSGAGSANNYSMRGLFNAETAATFDSPVGTYIDGIFMGRLNSSNFGLFDVERIEVLRGPQGTLFGRNTTGGAINIILRKPSSEFGGYVEGQIGNYDHKQIRGSIDLPLSDSIRTRFAGYYTREDGWAKNTRTGGSVNDHDGEGVRGSLSADITDTLKWDVAVDYSWDDQANISVVKDGHKYRSQSGLGYLSALYPDKKGDIPGNSVINKTIGVTSNLSLEASIGTLEFITGWRKITSDWNVDYYNGTGPYGGYASVQHSTHEQFSQELKLNGEIVPGLLYTAGLFYFHEENATNFSTVFTLASGFPFIDADRILYNDTNSMAGYAQFDLDLTPTITATVGGRYTIDDKDIHYRDNLNPRITTRISDNLLVAAGIPLNQSESKFTPRFVLRWKPNSDLMVYASATRGFKSGGWNVRGTNAATLTDFGSETIWSYEVGTRASMFDRKLTFNLTGFYGQTDDLQISTASIGPNGAPQFPVGNYAGLKSYGFELESTITPVRALTISLGAGYNKTDYNDISDAVLTQQSLCLASIQANAAARPNCGAGIITRAGDIADTARSPEWTLSGNVAYELPVTGDWNLVPAVSGRYVSSFNTNAAQLVEAEDDGYFMLSGSLAFENRERNMAVSVVCENCNNASYLLTTIGGRFWYNSPRRIYGRVRFGF